MHRFKIPPPLLGLLLALLAWCANETLPNAPRLILPDALKTGVMGVLMLLAVVFDGVAIVHFFRKKTTVNPLSPQNASVLVTTGIYRFSRNPMYLGIALWLVVWAIFLGHPVAWLSVIAFILIIQHFQILPEERFLREKFGEDFNRYCAQTRRWI